MGKETISKWLKNAMREAEIDKERYKPPRTRSAATSASCKTVLSVKDSLAVAGWSNENTFRECHYRPISSETQFPTEIPRNN